MKNIKFTAITFILILIGFNTPISGKEIHNNKVFKDPGVINKERILYWLTKRGELKANATEAEKKIALKNYLRRAENGGYRLPAKLAKAKAELQDNLNKQKADIKVQKVQGKNAQNKTVNILAILVDFPDLPYNDNRLQPTDSNMYYADYNVAHYNDLIFSPTGYAGPSNQNLTSAYQYYQLVSGNSLTLQGMVSGWVTADSNADVYGGNDPDDDDSDQDVASLVREAVTKAVAAGGINLADFDVEDQFDRNQNNNVNEPDGIIDHVMIYHSSIGEEQGGGVLGDDAIWSHRSFINTNTWGYTIPGTNYAVMGYTIEPLDAAIGVVVHEFGHDLGVRDEYNTDSNETADGSPVGFWSVMSSGSWGGAIPGTQPTGFSPLASHYFQQQFGGNWTDTTTLSLANLMTTPQTVALTESVNHEAATNLIKVDIPGPLLTFFPPFTGNYQYYSGDGDMKNYSMSFPLSVPNATIVELQMKAHWNIELDYDYARVLIDNVAIAGNYTKTNNPQQAGITNYITDISANLAGATGSEGWVTLTFDMSAYQGQNVTVTIEYVTDPAVGDYGFVVDDIELLADTTSSYFDGAEITPGPTLNGFTRITSTRAGLAQNYWVQMRSFNGVDIGLSAENYQRGMLVWFDDPNYSNNHVNKNPGHGFIGVVDARQVYSQGSGSTTQVRDATFSQYDLATSSSFDDGDDYSTPEQPASGKILPRHGLNFSLQSQQVDSTSASILFSVSQVSWSADFSHSKSFRTVTFANLSTGTGNSSASWDFGDGSALSSDWEPTHTYQSSGDFTVTLTVTTISDNSTDVSQQTVSVAELLTASYQATDNNGVASFTATTSGGEGAYTYAWDFGDSSAAGTGDTTSHTYATSGSYSVTLTVTSADNQTATSTQSVDIYILPVAGYTVSTNNLVANFSNTSTGGDGNLTYVWDFGEGGSSTDASPAYTYANAGTYTVELTVTDGQSNSSSISRSVTVSVPAPPPTPPSGGGGGGSTGFLLIGLLLLGGRLKKSFQ